MSLQILCDTQQEIDAYWAKLSQGGDPKAQVCGWLKDKYGVSWQVIPRAINEWVAGQDEKAQRAMKAMLQMKKIDINDIKRAYEGRAA
jgi:predicted 3-demethylubiquinone-9 3-methyltransferase (glyoxalase superfamily)